MIELVSIKKQSKLALMIQFDEEGSKELIRVLKDTINTKNELIKVNYNFDTIDLEFIQDNNLDEIIFSSDKIVINMHKDEIEYLMDRLIESKDCRYFYPAEICECSYKGKTLDVYGELITNHIEK